MDVLTPQQLSRRSFLRLAGAAAGSALLAGCVQLPPVQPASVPSQKAPMNARILCPYFHGFGAQGDFFLTLPPNAGRGVKEEDIELVFDRVRAMRPHIMRTFFNYDWWEPVEGAQTPDSPEMQDYVGWVRFLNEVGCAVMLVPWGDTFAYSYWMHATRQTRLPAPDQRGGMIRSLVELVDYLRNEQGLTNLRYLCLMNEPDNDPARRVPVLEFVALYRDLDRALAARGLREAVQIVGVDGSNWAPAGPGEWFHDVVREGLDYADAVASHTYGHRDTSRLVPWIQSRTNLLSVEARTAGAGHSASPRPLMITEFNSYGDTFTNPENHTYDHGLFLADFAITALQQGVAAVLVWCLMDTWYDENHKQQYGLWRFRNEGWEPRPGFYSWSLITRYTRPGSTVVEVEIAADDNASGSPWPAQAAVGLVAPDGRLTVLALNRAVAPVQVRLTVPGINPSRQLHVYAYTESRMQDVSAGVLAADAGGLLPVLGSVEADSEGGFGYEMPAKSFVVFADAV